MNTTRIPLLFLLLFSTVLSAQIYVSPNGTGDGSSWAQASSIEDALANATSNQTLWLRRGTYAISTMLEIDSSQNGLRFFGGFVGTETALSQRDWAANVTILDGLTTTQIIHINGNDCVFDGITFVRGFTTGDVTATNTGGGAMYVGAGNNIIRNCTFRNNVSTSARGGGAMYIRSGTGLLVQNCTFENNRNPTVNYPSGQNGGGAIHNWTGNVTIQNSRFINNYSGQSGGAIYTWGQNLTLNNCVFNNNRTDGYGGAVHVNYFDTTFSNCNFQGNQSGGSGGAISNQHIISVNNSQFNGNTAQENGGAIYERGNISTILNSAFISNSAQVNGGAIYSNPPFTGDYLSISNILFYNNSSSSYGGAIYNGSDIRITNSTFVNNTNTALVHHFRESSTYYTYNTTVNNSIFYNNTKHTGLQYPDIAPYSSNDISDKDFRRNLLQENPLGVGNVLGVNPLFINAATGNFRLQINSPAIEYGRNILYTNVRGTGLGTDTDLGGDPRLFGTYVDAGAYERQSASTLTPPSCISTITPANNATNVAVNTNITWNSVATAIGYRISIGTTSGGTELVNNADVTTGTSYNPATDFPEDTEIFVSVIPYNSVGNATGCPEISFTTETLATIPGCATITSPTDGATDVNISTNITWNAVSGADGYYVSIGTTSGGTELVNNADVTTGTSYNPTSDFPEGTEVFVSVIPYNSAGNATGCSGISFTTETLATVPNCTVITSPTNGATDVNISTNITWNAVSGADGYYISIGTTSGGTELVDNADVTTGTSYNPTSDFPEDTEIFVSVIPYNAAGNATGCSGISFTTETLVTVPNCATITSPTNGATDVNISTNITWNAVTGADGYYVNIGTTSGGTELVNNADVTTGTSYNPTSDFPEDTDIFVSVIPYNSVGPTTGCSGISFTTETLATVPGCTTITGPTDGATDVAVDANIVWNAVTGADGYYVNIGTTSGGTELVNNADVTTGTSYNPTTDFPENTNIFISVIPYNSVGPATGCSGISFTTETLATAPTCTTIISPTNGATDVNISTNITWNAVSGADGYYVSIGTSSSGTELVDNADVTTGTSYNPTTDFPEDTEIFVSVIPYNSVGEATGCSGISFTTEEIIVPTVPDCATIAAPTNGATDVAVNANIVWNAVTDADGYYVNIGTTSGGTELVDNADVTSGTSYNPTSDFPEDTEIFVSVIPYNSAGNATGCSEISFTTEDTTPAPTVPNCTVITGPTDGATDVAVNANIVWNAVSGADGYYVSIGTTSGGTELVDNADVTTGTSYNPTTDFPEDTEIFVSVIPYNSAGNATGCSGISFTTETRTTDLVDETKYGFSPNGDGINDVWVIHGIENYPENIVSIYNRWGDMVFQIRGYNNGTNVFRGTANRLRSLGADQLPSGTYFFQIENLPEQHHLKKTTGFLVLKR